MKRMKYETWRISFQSSEQAAPAAFNRAAELEAQLAAHLSPKLSGRSSRA